MNFCLRFSVRFVKTISQFQSFTPVHEIIFPLYLCHFEANSEILEIFIGETEEYVGKCSLYAYLLDR